VNVDASAKAYPKPPGRRRLSAEAQRLDMTRRPRQAAGVPMEVLFASLPVADLHVAMGWYEQIFGRAADIVPNKNEVTWCVAGNGWLYVIQDPERAGRTVVTISVSDLDQFVADLASRGISAGPIESVGDAGRKANLVDADGNVISWIQVGTRG
jgi:predicted enzyme related to lactoylglutathione lyase